MISILYIRHKLKSIQCHSHQVGSVQCVIHVFLVHINNEISQTTYSRKLSVNPENYNL